MQDSVTIQPIPVDQIPLFFQKVSNIEIEITQLTTIPQEINDLDSIIDYYIYELADKNEFLIDSVDNLKLNSLNSENIYWQNAKSKSNEWNDRLSEYLKRLNAKQNELDLLIEEGKVTTENAEEGSIPGEMLSMLAYSMSSLEISKKKISDAINATIRIQAQLSPSIALIDDSQNRIKKAQDEFLFHIWLPEQPPIWKYTKELRSQFKKQSFQETLKKYWQDNRNYWNENKNQMVVYFLLFLIISFYLLYLKRNRKKLKEANEEFDFDNNILLKHPFLTSFLLLAVIVIIFSEAPGNVIRFIALISSIPAAIMLYRFAYYVRLLQVISFLFFILTMQFIYLVEDINSYRIFLLIVAPILGTICFLVIKKTHHFFKTFKELRVFLETVLQLFFIISVISFIANVVGSVEFSSFLLLNAITSIIVGVFLYIGSLLLINIVAILIIVPPLNRSKILSNYHDKVLSTIRRLSAIFSIAIWFYFTFSLFNLWDDVSEAFIGFFTREIVIGELNISIISIIYFFATIIISIWLSRILRFIINEEVFKRTEKESYSLSGTVNLVIRYSFITLGVVLAFAAAGIDLSKLTVLLGALGVGIGFGLQNLFNNLISGIFLAFERPIKVGDVVDVADLQGIVMDIGFRASIIRTWSGAEVIVPNGDLISGKLVNWTLSDKRKRYGIDLTIAHGNDPSKVLELLRECALECDPVLKNPTPIPRFLGLNQYGMSFQLLFWLPDINNGFGPRTQLNSIVYNRLNEHGITIQFARTDVHIYDKDEGIVPLKAEKKKKEIKPKEED